MDTLQPLDDEHVALAADLAAQGVEFAVGSWIDILGRARSKVVPISHLPNLIAGSERYTPRGMADLGQMTPNEDESAAVPDVSTLRVTPWDPKYAWMAADLRFGGKEPFALCTRSILKEQIARAAAEGFRFNLGVEMELYAFKPESLERTDGYLEPVARSGSQRPTQAYDVEAVMDAEVFIGAMARCMKAADFGLFSFDTEGGDGQYEFDFDHAEVLETADRLTFFRLMAKQVAKQAGLLATFMPKPYTSAWGSGAHFNMSLTDVETDQNLFRDEGDPRGRGWSKTAYGFVGGLLRHAPAMAAVATPTVNSYKRLSSRLADGTVSWAPIWAAYGDNNRSCMLRLPRNRPAVENRSVDTAANVYVASAFMLAAGLEGVREGMDPGPPVEELAYDPVTGPTGSHRLPRNLLEAIEAFEADPLTHEVFSSDFISAYTEMKRAEWDEYHQQVGEWERSRYLLAF
jgi:glutamine synthetase